MLVTTAQFFLVFLSIPDSCKKPRASPSICGHADKTEAAISIRTQPQKVWLFVFWRAEAVVQKKTCTRKDTQRMLKSIETAKIP